MPNSHRNIAIYARYSSDLQNPSSVDDQIALCRRLINENFKATKNVLIYSDSAISGATLERPGVQNMLDAAKSGRFSLIVAEGLDRLSRSLKDIAIIHELLAFYGASIWTAHEGKISELHIGLKGTMNALFLKDMKEKVRRGQRARVAAGYVSSSCAYGYSVVRGVVDERGRPVNGVRQIREEQANIVRRIYDEFISGRSFADIIISLNQDGIPAPGGGIWRRTALSGSPKKGEGILRAEIYRGNIIYNRTSISRDPITGRRRYVVNPESEWVKSHVEELRIVAEPIWEKVQELLIKSTREIQKEPKKPKILKVHNQHALTGWIRCGHCGGLKSLASDTRYVCSNWRYTRKCTNSRGSKEPALLEAVFDALQKRIKNGPDFRASFVAAYAADQTRHQRALKDEKAVQDRIARLLRAVEEGVHDEHVTGRITKLQEDLAAIRARQQADAPPILPAEAALRSALYRAVGAVKVGGDIVAHRLLFEQVLDRVTTTPRYEQRSGETIEVRLLERGWAAFWRRVAAGEVILDPA